MTLNDPIEFLADIVAISVRDGNHCLTEDSISQILSDNEIVLKMSPGVPKRVIEFLLETKALNEVIIQSTKFYFWTGCNTYPRLWDATGLSFLLSIPWWQYKQVTRWYKYFYNQQLACWIGQIPCPLWMEVSKAHHIPMENIDAILWAYTEAEILVEVRSEDSDIEYLFPYEAVDMEKLFPSMLIQNLFFRNQLTIAPDDRIIN